MNMLSIIAQRNRSAPAGLNYRAEVLADSPAAYWRLGEASGTSAADEVGAFPGTYSGTYTLGNAGPMFGTALGLSGSNGEMAAAPQVAINSAAAATLECWMYRATTGERVLAGFGVSGRIFGLQWETSSVLYAIAMNGATSYRNVTLAVTGWHHVVMVFDGSLVGSARIAIYFDGVLQSPATSGSQPATLSTTAQLGNISAGKQGATSSTGRISDVALYATALSAGRIAAHYAARLIP